MKFPMRFAPRGLHTTLLHTPGPCWTGARPRRRTWYLFGCMNSMQHNKKHPDFHTGHAPCITSWQMPSRGHSVRFNPWSMPAGSMKRHAAFHSEADACTLKFGGFHFGDLIWSNIFSSPIFYSRSFCMRERQLAYGDLSIC